MKKLTILLVIFTISKVVAQKTPCKINPVYRQFDFWIGEWEAYGINGKKAGDSKITLVLDSCIVLEEWTSVAPVKGVTYSGKSFNTYNATTNQWQQTWVDNVGGTTEYLEGKLDHNTLIFSDQTIQFFKRYNGNSQIEFFQSGIE